MTELDETVCPVCGKKLVDWTRWAKPHTEAMYLSNALGTPIWAVAHYLAHLVQQNQSPSFGVMHGPDDPPDEPR